MGFLGVLCVPMGHCGAILGRHITPTVGPMGPERGLPAMGRLWVALWGGDGAACGAL